LRKGAENGCPPFSCNSGWQSSYLIIFPYLPPPSPSSIFFPPNLSYTQPSLSLLSLYSSPSVYHYLDSRLLLHIFSFNYLLLIVITVISLVDPVVMRRRQHQPVPSPSSSDNEESDSASCFDTRDEQEETDIDNEPTDVDTDVDEDDKTDLLDLGWLARKEDHANTIPMDVDIDVDRDDEADLAWIAGEENAHPPEYYLDQEDNCYSRVRARSRHQAID
jgi:hypothetical protein